MLPIGSLTPATVAPASLLASGAPSIAPTSPVDAVGPTVASPGTLDPRMASLLFRPGRPTQLERFFGRDAERVEKLEPMPVSQHAPRGGWTISYRDARGHTSGQRMLRNHEDSGRGNGGDAPPFGRWIRCDDGWLAECVKTPEDPDGAVQASMLRTWLPDSGALEMTLWEIHADGGGVVFKLDPGRDFTQAPPVVDLVGYAPGQAPQAPFLHHLRPPSTSPDLADHFGAVPAAEVSRGRVDVWMPRGGWHVRLDHPEHTVVSLEMNLRDDQEPGYVQGGPPAADAPLRAWTRTASGWVNEARGRLTPELFGSVRSSKLITTLGNDGTVGMQLHVERPDGGGVVYTLDGDAYRRRNDVTPAVVSVQAFAPSDAHPPLSVPPPAGDGGVVDQGGYIIVDGVRIPKR